MKSIALVLLFVAVTFCSHSFLTNTCGKNCKTCWSVGGPFTDNICAECENGYYFVIDQRDVKCVNDADYRNGRDISGYKRTCAVCGLHNYLNNNLDCKPCSIHCDKCFQGNDGKCNSCFVPKVNPDQLNEFIVDDNGDCVCKFGIIIDGFCMCNKFGHFYNIDNDYSCDECSICTRNQKSCPDTIPFHMWDDDMVGCPKYCHDGCSECSSYERDMCTDKTSQGIPFCYNQRGWEDVIINGETKCFCVCHSHEIVHSEKDIHDDLSITCECEENRELVDTCAGKTCTDNEKLRSFQCVCKSGYMEGDANAAGFVPCVPMK